MVSSDFISYNGRNKAGTLLVLRIRIAVPADGAAGSGGKGPAAVSRRGARLSGGCFGYSCGLPIYNGIPLGWIEINRRSLRAWGPG